MRKIITATVHLALAFLFTFVLSDPALYSKVIPGVHADVLQELIGFGSAVQVLSGIRTVRAMIGY